MIKFISKRKKLTACFLLIIMLNEMIMPTVAYALTGGPSQPEVQAFEPETTDNMVDPFSGDFVYNLPLLKVGEYPINISYHSGISMDQEASWVGLGWNINPGVINRNMRGLPDDFMGDPIAQEHNIKTNWTAGVDLGAGIKFIGLPFGLGANMGIFYNNYKGVGFKGGTSFNFSFSFDGAKAPKTSGMGGSVGIGLSFNSQEGIGVSPSVGLSMEKDNGDSQTKTGGSLGIGLSYNSRAGLGALTFSLNVSEQSKRSVQKKNKYGKDKGLHDRYKDEGGMNGHSSISFSAAAVTPSIELPMENFAFTAGLQVGGEVEGMEITGNITGNYTQQKLAYHRDTLPGYGYLYFDKAAQDPRALLDYNREKDQPFRKPSRMMGDEGTPLMAIPNYEFDVMSVSGQGISGQYRPMRGDLGAVYDHKSGSKSASGSVNLDVSLGDLLGIGVNFDITRVNTNTSAWDDGNDLYHSLRFYPEDNTLYEPVYYTNIGEKTINDQSFYDALGDTDPIRPKIEGWWLDKKASSVMERYESNVKVGEFPLNTFKKKQRDKRNQAISYLKASESVAALDQKILNYPLNSYPLENCDSIPTAINQIPRIVHSNYRGNHISEVTVLGTDGKRYVYGIPAYNRVQKEVSFNIDNSRTSPANLVTGLAPYVPGDNSVNNNIGLDNYFSSQTIPDFSHSFLLTAVLSQDYVDLTGNGISDDDLGDAVKINYTRVYGQQAPLGGNDGLYKWRTPIDQNQANYQEGFKTNTFDDKGNYLYGEKEIWYVNSIESKTMVAVFRLSDRQDGLGVLGENGGVDTTAKLKKLDRIDLYSKSDRLNHGEGADPIKSVFFEYSYQLCPGVGNNINNVYANGNQGKLTLTKVYFTYQKNTKGRLNPYTFEYNNSNPPYHIKHYDRWGNYKCNSLEGVPVPDAEFPYTSQNGATADADAAAWSLSKIHLPTGGAINVVLEADRYGYVQNQRAMQMYNIYGVGSDSNYTTSDQLYHSDDFFSPWFNTYLYIKVDNPIVATTTSAIRAEILHKYLDGVKNLYFRASVFMPDNPDPAKAEYVPGYAQIDDSNNQGYGLCPNAGSGRNIIFIRLQAVPKGNHGTLEMNPIQKTAMQFLRINLPFLAYPGSQQTGGGFLDIIKALIAPLFDMENMFFGFSNSVISRGWCKELNLTKSWVRLNNPFIAKYGGGARVKQVTLEDSWDQMVAGEAKAVYGQVYDYTMIDPDTKETISSGVAEYEPSPGQDENPFRQPLIFHQNTLLAPHNQLYVEMPIGESFFPSASVGYRQVTISSYGSTLVSADKKTGYSVHQFYTGFDFPIFTDYTPLSANDDKIPSVFQILQLPSIEHFLGSQGFQVELNDMHGKPKAEEVHDNTGALISKTTYDYQVVDPAAPNQKLNTLVPVMLPDGTTSTKNIGKEMEAMFDSRKQETIQKSGGGLIHADIIFLGPFPIPLPSYFPAFAREETTFKSLTCAKVIRRYGLLKSTTTTQYGSSVTTENLLYDSETGEVLMTRTKNEFEDPIYNFTYPAHMAYTGMGPASQNVGAEFKNVNVSTGVITSPTSIIQYFTPGDEILFSGYTYLPGDFSHIFGRIYPYSEKLWVIDPHSMDPTAAHQTIFVDQGGLPFTDIGTMKITRSGHRNMQNMPIGTITSLMSPMKSGGLNPIDTLYPQLSDSILNVTNTEYSEQWKINCQKLPTMVCDTCPQPSCECMSNLVHQVFNVLDTATAPKKASDSIFIYSSCYDSCFGSNNPYTHGARTLMYMDSATPTNIILGRCTLSLGYAAGLPADSAMMSTCSYPQDGDNPYRGGYGKYIDGTFYVPYRMQFSKDYGIVLFYYTFKLTCPNGTCARKCVDLTSNHPINPYRYGLLGNWRPVRQWAYRGLRSYDNIASDGSTNIRRQGTFTTYDPFWVYNSTQGAFMKNASLSDKYIDATTITKYNPKGAEIENRDAAGIYSAAQFGYLNTQAVAVAKNARYKDIGFDGFEDYDFVTDCFTPCRVDHFDYKESLTSGSTYYGYIDTTVAHSGYRSLKVPAAGAGTARMSRDLIPDSDLPGLTFDSINKLYDLTQYGCLPVFSPDSGKYFVSVWVREPDSCIAMKFTNSQVKVSFSGSSATYTFTPSGNVIDGWQRIEGVCTVPAAATQIYIDLMSLNGIDVNFDDLRAQPFNSSMKTYVYDWRSLRLMAELDENNFASFYEYDDEGGLIRIKKETQRGIMTIQETRSVLKK